MQNQKFIFVPSVIASAGRVMCFFDFCEEATRKIRRINDHFLLLLGKELLEAIRQNDAERENGEIYRTLGWDCDRETWLDFTQTVSAEIDRRQLSRRV